MSPFAVEASLTSELKVAVPVHVCAEFVIGILPLSNGNVNVVPSVPLNVSALLNVTFALTASVLLSAIVNVALVAGAVIN